jgi:hypothetical protein
VSRQERAKVGADNTADMIIRFRGRTRLAVGVLPLSGSVGHKAQHTEAIRPEAPERIDWTMVSIDTLVPGGKPVIRIAMYPGREGIHNIAIAILPDTSQIRPQV